MERFKAILLHDHLGCKRGTLLDVAARGDNFAGRWLILLPTEIAGSWVLPSIDADRAITVVEAARALTTRRGHNVPGTTVRRYLEKGTISCAGRLGGNYGALGGPWMMSRDEVWTFPWPQAGNPNWIRQAKERKIQEAAREAEKAS